MDEEEDPIKRAYEARRPRPKPRLVRSIDEPRPALELHLAKLPDPATIPPRRWLYGSYLVRGFVTVLVAPGGTGKTAYAIGVALSLATGISILGDHIFEPVNVAVINLDDPIDELDRRVAALTIRHKIPRASIDGRLFLDDGDRGLTMAAIGDDGYNVIYPDVDALIEQIKKHDIGLIICDPFAESHSLEENSNPHMVKAASAWRNVARATDCAVLLVHHVRKGDASGIDAARGAKALTDSARIGLLMSGMNDQDGEAFGVDQADRWQYVRLDDAKRNMAPAQQAKWFKLEQVPLGNTMLDRLYPRGDNVGAIAPWDPLPLWQSTSTTDLNRVLDLIAAGPEPGVLYTKSKQGGGGRWCGLAICQTLGVAEGAAKQLVAKWLETGLLFEKEYKHKTRHVHIGIHVNETLRPS